MFLLWLRLKAWPWLKTNPWRALTFLVGAIGAILVLVFGRRNQAVVVQDGTNTDKALAEHDQEEQKHNQEVKNVEQQAQQDRDSASKKQVSEASKLSDQPPGEVAKWIDKF